MSDAISDKRRLAWGKLLSRLAAFQGVAVPAHRLAHLSPSDPRVDWSLLPAHDHVRELWHAYFQQAQSTLETDLNRLGPADFPLLWVPPDGTGDVLLLGRQASGEFLIEQADGSTARWPASALNAGHALRLTVAARTISVYDPLPQTATGWFLFTLGRYRRVFIEAGLATVVVSVLGLFAALYTMQVYDRVVPTKGYATLWVLTVGVLLAIGLELLLRQVRASMVDGACKLMDQELSAVFFGKALDIRMDARPRTVGTFAAQVRHFESVRGFMTSSTLFILADAPFALLFIGVIAWLAGPVAWVPAVMVPVTVLAGWMFHRPIERHTARHMEESNQKNGVLIEAIDGIESIKSVNAEWKWLDRWRHLTATIADSELRLRRVSTLATNLTQTVQQLSYVGLVAAGAYAITQGNLTVGGLIACSIIGGRALAPLAQIPQLMVQWKQAQIALHSLNAIMALPSERAEQQSLIIPTTCRGELRLDKVQHIYAEGVPALDVPSLALRAGERVAVLGSVGSGKSTLIKLLSGLYKPTAGKAMLDGIDMMHLAPEYVREQIGYLPQDVRLFEGTLRDNLTLGLPPVSDSLVLNACAASGFDRLIAQHPKGLGLTITEGGRGLSGGQKQLLGLTRLLLARPTVLLLDEPTASMDGTTEAMVMRHLMQVTTGMVVIVTHKLSLMPLVERIVVLDKGKVVMDGPRDAVMARLKSEPPPPASSAPIPTSTDPARST